MKNYYLVLIIILFSSQFIYAEDPIMRDPTQPAVPEQVMTKSSSSAEPIWGVQSIISAPTRTIAVITFNNVSKFVRVGDTIGVAKVKRITKNTVILITPEQTITLYLFEKPHLE